MKGKDPEDVREYPPTALLNSEIPLPPGLVSWWINLFTMIRFMPGLDLLIKLKGLTYLQFWKSLAWAPFLFLGLNLFTNTLVLGYLPIKCYPLHLNYRASQGRDAHFPICYCTVYWTSCWDISDLPWYTWLWDKTYLTKYCYLWIKFGSTLQT